MSTFNELIQKNNTEKITLLEISIGKVLGILEFIPYSPGTYKVKYSNPLEDQSYTTSYGYGMYGYGAYGGSVTTESPAITGPDGVKRVVETIRSVLANATFLTEVSSLSNLTSTDGQFYFDEPNQLIYIHLPNSYAPYLFTSITAGVLRGYATKAGYYDGVYYQNRIGTLSPLEISRDSGFFGKIQYNDVDATLINHDGAFDDIETWDVYGQSCIVKIGFDDLDYDDYETIYTGFFQEFQLQDQNLQIKISDPRKLLTRKVGTSTLSQTTYADMKDDYIGKPIPIGYGTIKAQEALCVNDEETTPSSYTFVFIDTTYRTPKQIDNVYVDGVEVSTASETLASGTFTLSTSDYEPGQDVTIDYIGYVEAGNAITNAFDIIKDILLNYLDIPYNTDYYDTTSWTNATSGATESIYYSTGFEQIEIIEIIESIVFSVSYFFGVDEEGLYFANSIDIDKLYEDVILNEDMFDLPVPEYKPDEFLSSAKVGYQKKHMHNSFRYAYDTDSEATLYARYKRSKLEEFETQLVSLSDSESFATSKVTYYGGVFPVWTVTTSLRFMWLSVGDNVVIQTTPIDFSTNSFRIIKGEILTKTIDPINFSLVLVIRKIEDLTELPEIDLWTYAAGMSDALVKLSNGYFIRV